MLIINKIEIYQDHILHCILIMLTVLMLSACGSQTNSAQVDTSAMRAVIVTAEDVNPNTNGQPAPINVYIYELKSVDNFKNSDFFTISGGDDPLVNNDIAKMNEFILRPGESKNLDIKPGADTIAIGVVAAYREINKSDWNKVYMLPVKVNRVWYKKILPKNERRLQVSIHKLAISIEKMD
ncbi:type VI secretion system lipoprotein TssJ [Rouxiella sp. Mn2063]|uniref:type VI secretion system lipoprotein TssJ n=1 Tax=Rouxiella sp. Mn2063 TaxID=3395262 RepID=UPI003BCFFE85